MSDSHRFIIDVSLNGYRVTMPNGRIVQLDDPHIVASEAHRLYRQLQNIELMDSLQGLINDADWNWPEDNDVLPTHGDCVYFATSKAFPGTVKIGRSSVLRSRMKSLGKEHGGGRFRAIAYAMTSEMHRLERAFHLHFSQYRAVRLEFFEEGPVKAFLFGGRE